MTLVEMCDELAAELDVDAERYPTTTAVRHVNRAVRYLDRQLIAPWCMAQDTLTTEVGRRHYSPSTDLGGGSPRLQLTDVLAVYYLGAEGDEVVLEQLTYEELRATYPLEAEAGPPLSFALWGDELWLGPAPDDAYELSVDYRGRQHPLINDGDTNGWLEREPDAVLYQAGVYASTFLLEDERTAVFARLAEDALQQIVIDLSHADDAGRRTEAEEY